MRFSPLISLAFLVVSAAGMSRAQESVADSAGWHGVTMHFQQTFVWQNHTRFKSPYQGAIGDGKLPNYSPETIIEAYYQIQLDRRLNCTLDYQGVLNPAYNRDRGPVNFGGIRIHFEL